MTRPTVAILGASTDRSKFGNKSVRAHLRAGFEVFPVNPKGGEIEGLPAYRSLAEIPAGEISRVSLYLPPVIGLKALDDIAARGCGEVWFNPGSDSPAMLARAKELGLRGIQACSIVALGLSPSQFSDE